MKQKQSSRRKRSSTKSVLRLPDLEHAKGVGDGVARAATLWSRARTAAPTGRDGAVRGRSDRAPALKRAVHKHLRDKKVIIFPDGLQPAYIGTVELGSELPRKLSPAV